jgi:hypothetical protein
MSHFAVTSRHIEILHEHMQGSPQDFGKPGRDYDTSVAPKARSHDGGGSGGPPPGKFYF